jgi:hypothetical protein
LRTLPTGRRFLFQRSVDELLAAVVVASYFASGRTAILQISAIYFAMQRMARS